jgi:hypothetical protein
MGEPMMNDTERQLQARLGPALDGLTPRPAPLGAIVRDGRRVKVRKRISLAAGLVAVAAAAVAAILAVPSLLSGSTSVPPLTTHYRVTVNPPAPHSPPGLIASGRVGGVPWSVRADRSGNGYFFSGIGTYVSTGTGNLPGRFGNGDPVQGFLTSFARSAIQVLAVRTDVTIVQVLLTNGQVLSLRPVVAAGASNASLVAFAVPDYRDVLAIEAFGKSGEIGYTVPWTGHSFILIGRWLKPGQPALPRPQTAVIGSGTAFGQSWRQLVTAGPWGWCGQGDIGGRGGGGGCLDVLPPLKAGQYYQIAGFAGGSAIGQSGLIEAAQVADSVAFVELTTRSGQHIWVRPHRVGGQSFISFATAISGSAPQTVTRWVAYDRYHHLLASGSA